MLNLNILLDGIEQTAAARDIDRYHFLHILHLTSIARRCLLGRFPEHIERLRPLWVNNGASERVVALAVEAARFGTGPGRIIGTRSEQTAALFSSAHADFVHKLSEIEHEPKAGPFGEAIHGSRYAIGEGGDCHFLADESRLPIGFPVVHLAEARPEFGFRDFAWVEPTSKWPVWLADHKAALAADQLQESRRERFDQVRKLLSRVEKSVRVAISRLGFRQAPERQPGIALPDWLTLYVLDFDFEDFGSAGLALALQRLSDLHGWPIPAGVGFTGSWQDGRLQAVTGIRGKLRAAREAGIFVLFACAEDDEVSTLQPVDREGVTLALLEKNALIDEVVVRVNTVCHDLGLTEYRWRRAVKNWENRVLGRRDEADLSRLLPDAAEKTCPVGFVGRECLLMELDRANRARKAAMSPSSAARDRARRQRSAIGSFDAARYGRDRPSGSASCTERRSEQAERSGDDADRPDSSPVLGPRVKGR